MQFSYYGSGNLQFAYIAVNIRGDYLPRACCLCGFIWNRAERVWMWNCPTATWSDAFNAGRQSRWPTRRLLCGIVWSGRSQRLPLSNLARGRGNACVVISDVTRPVPNAVILPPILETLEAGGILP